MEIIAATNEPVNGRQFVHRYYSLITDVGGYVCRLILQYEISQNFGQNTVLAEFLDAHKQEIDDFYTGQNGRRKILTSEQMEYLFPEGRAAQSAERFDLTLILFLLRAFIFCDPRSKAMWGRPLTAIFIDNTSVMADVARIKCYRNKMHDISDTNTSLSEKDFWELWAKLTRIFLHLGDQYHIQGIFQMIEKVLHEPLDEQREQKLDRDIKRLHDDMKTMVDHGKNVSDFMQAIDVDQTEMKKDVGEIKNLLYSKDHGPKLVDDVLADEYFVETEQSKEVLKMLQTNRIIILQGAPGEGKTTLAKRVVKKVSKVSCIQMKSWAEWDSNHVDKSKVDAILIDDMFGAGVFDKQESRKWQKYLPGILQWVNESPEIKRYVVITSRTYILQKAREQLYLENAFDQNNFYTLSSQKLEKKEKLSILRNHFASAIKKSGGTHFTELNKNKSQTKTHANLLENISKLEPTTQCQPFTIGFPECARLFSNNEGLYKKGKLFFQTPMKNVIKFISEISKSADICIAFFVLWAQKSKTLTSRDLEKSVSETPDCIKIPILKFQHNPKDCVRTIRKELAIHAHSEGVITLDSDNSFRFSHNVVRDAVGLNAYHINATAVLALCDSAFIENYFRILNPSVKTETQIDESENLTLTLPKSRYDQLSLRIGELTISETQEAAEAANELRSEKHQEIDKSDQVIKNYSILKHSIFDSEEFCTAFIQCHRAGGILEVLLTTELRTITSEFIRYKFLDSIETAIRLPSFLIWQTESISVFAKLLFTEMKKYPNILEKEMSMGMLIGSMFVSREIVEFLSDLGGKVTHKMILLAYETSKTFGLDEQKKQAFIQLLESQIGVTEPNCSLKIHAAAFEGCLDIVERILENDPSQANSTYTALDSTDLQKASLYHIAAYKQNSDLIETLVRYKVESNVFDGKKRSPFLYAISKSKHVVVEDLYKIAKEHGHEMTPDDSENTPLHMSIIKSVKGDVGCRKTFRYLSLKLAKTCPSKIHIKNSRDLTPLQVAWAYNATEVVEEMVIRQKVHLAEEEIPLIHDFVKKDNRKAIEMLWNNDFDKNKLLKIAESFGQMEVVAFIKDHITQNSEPCPLEP